MGSGLLIIATRIIRAGAITALILLLLGASTLVLLHMLAVGRACRQSLRAVNRAAGFLEPGNGLSSDDLDNLPCFEISTQNGGGEGGADGCALCLESFEPGDRCRILPACQHSFHARCVDRWLVRSPFCPMCRSNAGRRCSDSSSLSGCAYG
ncbi:RING-H2 finger protein ATL74 [Platanthera zijinensis]|uniref:RING-H2 finger protein ATL74 n=1 Tax=Platanthera zijinensis TaxID=2320716 RepID=A0AAP0AVJ7_9ASPA